MSVNPTIDERIFDLAPDFRAVSLAVTSAGTKDHDFASHFLEQAVASVCQGGPPWADAHLDAWAAVFRQFGSKPQRTPCSAGALRKRTLRNGTAPSINPVVDVYNAISLKFAIPVGGEDLATYRGTPCLTLSAGSEPFETIHNGEPTVESPDEGEVIWRDDDGVTCRKWNWRQCVRTQIRQQTTNMWFILESLAQLPSGELETAADELQSALNAVLKHATFSSTWIGGKQ